MTALMIVFALVGIFSLHLGINGLINTIGIIVMAARKAETTTISYYLPVFCTVAGIVCLLIATALLVAILL